MSSAYSRFNAEFAVLLHCEIAHGLEPVNVADVLTGWQFFMVATLSHDPFSVERKGGRVSDPQCFVLCLLLRPRSILARLHNSIVDNVVYHRAVVVERRKQQSLCLPPLVLLIGLDLLVFILVLEQKFPTACSRHHADIVKDLAEALQSPLLAQMAGQHPLTLAAQLGHTGLACIFLPLQQSNLLVGVDVKALGREARDQRTREGALSGRRVGVDADVGPTMLVTEVVGYLEREVVHVVGMW
jgi:hypothetical protein